ncbi:hypothetical protein AKJ09_03697 [Labilithrix luteola]|uniref:Uncharacterized protein n=1 Tax=Labilithrix luteola TaxID=1391654 RepID=A0A0K1PU15_9BACT|nr:hypothetical protein [Labilithrix luteola]AKU97033.1 hypothetical protein AKJ09_03697 [Labilithrix luteola]
MSIALMIVGLLVVGFSCAVLGYNLGKIDARLDCATENFERAARMLGLKVDDEADK